MIVGVSERNRKLVREALDAFNREGPEGMMPFLDQEVELYDPDLPGGGTFHGHDGVRTFLHQLLDSFETVHVQIEELHEAGDRVVGFIHSYGRGKGSGIEIEIHDAHTWTFQEGKVVHWRTYLDRNEALADAGLSGSTAPGH